MATANGSTVIGESILINGGLQGDEDLTVRGRVEGTVTLTRTLVVEPTGVVKAEVQVKNCIIAGVVIGNVTASESVEITKEGRMVGDIAAPRVIIVDGASFKGRVDMGEVDVSAAERSERPAPRALSRPAPRPALTARPASRSAPKEEAAGEVAAAPRPPAPPPALGVGAVKRKVVVKRK
ncbi:MAG TPA: polymer-forming cytoskeletal protein [Anaeromyxobacteraceae bacterium]|nr:polymer-forming cytoskeletal protein [Anaeromyxobacteraceae bacterium]